VQMKIQVLVHVTKTRGGQGRTWLVFTTTEKNVKNTAMHRIRPLSLGITYLVL
jgi:hypothetical protein